MMEVVGSEVDCKTEERRNCGVFGEERAVDWVRVMRWNLRSWRRGSGSGIRSRRLSRSRTPLWRMRSAQCARKFNESDLGFVVSTSDCIATMEGSYIQRGCGTRLAAPKVQEVRASFRLWSRMDVRDETGTCSANSSKGRNQAATCLLWLTLTERRRSYTINHGKTIMVQARSIPVF